MMLILAHAGHELHGPNGLALSDLAFAVLSVGVVLGVRSVLTSRGAWRNRDALLTCGLLALAASITPPLDRAAANSFAAHMLEHLVMMLVAGPLIALAGPELLLMRRLPSHARERMARLVLRLESGVRGPALVAGSVMLVALWGWHTPPLFDAALGSELLHFLQHASFLGASIIFWRFVLLLPAHGTNFFLPRAGLVFTAMAYSGALGALLVFSSELWYSGYRDEPAALLADQQASGLLMWLAGLPLYMGTLIWLVFVWLRRDEEEAARPQSQARPSLTADPTQQ
jgi:putative membrane protein